MYFRKMFTCNKGNEKERKRLTGKESFNRVLAVLSLSFEKTG